MNSVSIFGLHSAWLTYSEITKPAILCLTSEMM